MASRQWNPSRDASQLSSTTSPLHNSDLAQLPTDLASARFSRTIRSNHEGGSPGRQLEGSFVPYLPQDDAVAAGLAAHEGAIDAVETQEVADLLNEELRKLLKMPYREFWRTVTMDNSIQASLDSYLQFRRRWYDSAVNEDGTSLAGVIVGEQELYHHVFMVLYRMSSNMEAGSLSSDCLSLEEHAEIIQKKQLFDIPKLLDICAIYGHDNPDLTRHLVSNVFFAQKRFNDDLAEVVPLLLRTIHTMYQRCYSILMMQPSTSNSQNSVALKIQQELLELLDYLNDAVVALHSFNDAYPRGAIILVSVGNQSNLQEQILPSLTVIHDALLPTLRKSFVYLGGSAFTTHIESSVNSRLTRIRVRLMDLAWQLLSLSYLSKRNVVDHPRGTINFSQRTFTGDPGARGKAIVQVLSNMAADPSEGFGYQLAGGINKELISTGAFLRNIERKHKLLDTVDQLCQKGLIALDSGQYEHIAALVCYRPPFSSQMPNFSHTFLTEEKSGQEQEADIIHESKISHIKDILPDYGNGFIAACLEAYDYNPEEVLQRILEGTLHPSLQSLDKDLESKPNGSIATVCMKDKGKAKVNEPPSLALHENGSFNGTSRGETKDGTLSLMQRLASSTAASSSSSGESARMQPSSSVSDPGKGFKGRFVRKESGERNAALLLDERDAEDALHNAAYAAQYEDEYDDSFDDLGTHITDGVEETESLFDLVASKTSMGAFNSEETKKISNRVQTDGLPKSSWKGAGGIWRGEESSIAINSNIQPLAFASETGNKPFDTNKKHPLHSTRGRGRGRREEPRGQYFVKDGKNYSYKVAGSVAVSSVEEAEALRRAEEETIYGLGRGGNVPIKAQHATDNQNLSAENLQKSSRPVQGHMQMEFSERRGAHSHARGAPRKEHDNHHRKDRAMKKHFSSIGGM